MSVSKPVAFIIGYGANTGTAIARKFKNEGFKVAVSSRSLNVARAEISGLLGIKMDVADIKSIESGFQQVEELYGPANAVIFNVSNSHAAPGGLQDPFSLPYEHFHSDAVVNGISTYRIAQLAKAGFDKLPAGETKIFIGTGNLTPWVLFPRLLGLSVGKRALVNIVEMGAQAYGPLGQRFYFAHEVNHQEGPVYPPDPASHAKVFYDLYKQEDQGNWEVRFATGGQLWEEFKATQE